MRTKLTDWLFAIGCITGAFLLAFGGVSFAADAVATAPDGSLLDLAKPVFEAVMAGHWILGAALALILLVALVRRYVGPHVPFLHSDVGGALLSLAAGFGSGLAAALAAGGPVSWGLAWTALTVSVAAAGGYTLLAKLIRPLEDAAPAWLKPFLAMITWIFDKPDAAAEAAKAGDAAVAAHPAAGVEVVLPHVDDAK